MIFQDPMTALNPVLTIGKQMSEILVRNKGLSKKRQKPRPLHAGAGRHCRA
jgi:peptide/nickel transport system ATP-binding protein